MIELNFKRCLKFELKSHLPIIDLIFRFIGLSLELRNFQCFCAPVKKFLLNYIYLFILAVHISFSYQFFIVKNLGFCSFPSSVMNFRGSSRCIIYITLKLGSHRGNFVAGNKFGVNYQSFVVQLSSQAMNNRTMNVKKFLMFIVQVQQPQDLPRLFYIFITLNNTFV